MYRVGQEAVPFVLAERPHGPDALVERLQIPVVTLEQRLKAWHELIIDGDRIELRIVERQHKPSVIARIPSPRRLQTRILLPQTADDPLLARS